MKAELESKTRKLNICPLHQRIGKEMEMALLSKTPVKTLHKKMSSLCLERELP